MEDSEEEKEDIEAELLEEAFNLSIAGDQSLASLKK